MQESNNNSYYLNHLHEQVSFLHDACKNYDQGNFAQSKMISNIIRTLVKDPEIINRRTRTISLLTHLGKKDTMKFYNTGFEAKNAKLNVNLVGIVTVPTKLPTISKQFDNIFLPLLDTSSQVDVKWLSFQEWWNSEVIVVETESTTNIFTRNRIVMTMAEQDGGTHVDKKKQVDKEYLELATAAKSYFYHVDPNGNESPVVYMHYALVRQIAHELLISLIKEFNLNIDYKPTNEHNLRGVHKKHIKQPGMFVEGEKIESTRTSTPHRVYRGESFTTPPDARYVRLFF